MMFKPRTEVYSIPEFLHRHDEQPAKRFTIDKLVVVSGIAAGLWLGVNAVAFAATGSTDVVMVVADPAHPVSKVFDQKIWPLFLDIGEPLAKTMMAIGIYRCIRSDVDKGWKMVYRSGVGLVGLYLIDGAIHILQGVGAGLQSV